MAPSSGHSWGKALWEMPLFIALLRTEVNRFALLSPGGSREPDAIFQGRDLKVAIEKEQGERVAYLSSVHKFVWLEYNDTSTVPNDFWSNRRVQGHAHPNFGGDCALCGRTISSDGRTEPWSLVVDLRHRKQNPG